MVTVEKMEEYNRIGGEGIVISEEAFSCFGIICMIKSSRGNGNGFGVYRVIKTHIVWEGRQQIRESAILYFVYTMCIAFEFLPSFDLLGHYFGKL
jgi:hypothetical protein